MTSIKRIKVADYRGPWHPESVCSKQDRPCVIHNPSIHHMSDWPKWLAGERGLIERECVHGKFHPDPDSLRYFIELRESLGIRLGLHECDGCCLLPMRPNPVMVFDA